VNSERKKGTELYKRHDGVPLPFPQREVLSISGGDSDCGEKNKRGEERKSRNIPLTEED